MIRRKSIEKIQEPLTPAAGNSTPQRHRSRVNGMKAIQRTLRKPLSQRIKNRLSDRKRSRVTMDVTTTFSSTRHRFEDFMPCAALKGVLGPIATFLKGRVGRPWQKIWRELKLRFAGIPFNPAELKAQVADFVEFDVLQKDGFLCHGSGLWSGRPLTGGWRQRFFVCPVSGQLRQIEPQTFSRCIASTAQKIC